MKKYYHVKEVSAFEFDGNWESVQFHMPEEDQKKCELDKEGHLLLPPLDEHAITRSIADKGDMCVFDDNEWHAMNKYEFDKLFQEGKIEDLSVVEQEDQLTKILKKDSGEKFKDACKPLMDYMRDHCHPHCTAIVRCDCTEILEGIVAYDDPDNVND